MHCYALLLRPAGIGALPPDPYELVERGTKGYYPARRDLPEGSFPYGVVAMGRKLNEGEVEKWQLKYLGELATTGGSTHADRTNR